MMEINWELIKQEGIRYLTDLIQIDTTNPPGNEKALAQYLQTILINEGIEVKIYESAPGRANLVAIIKGNGAARPVALLAHMDVVAAHAEQWSHPPFMGKIADGYIWGRGALDMKGMLVMELLALLLYKRSRKLPKRDLILVAAADEEAGGKFGLDWLIKQNIPELEQVEYVINEGGEGTIREGVPVYACQNGEKGILWVKLTTSGTPGHASMPTGDNAILKMAKVLEKLDQFKQEITLCVTTRGYLKALAKQQGVQLSQTPALAEQQLKEFATKYFKGEFSAQAMFHNTITPTIIRSGDKANVLPDHCEMVLDCRLLPGENPTDFLKQLQQHLAEEVVDFEVLQAALPTESSLDTKLYRIIEYSLQQERPEAVLVPYLSPGGTDSRVFRERGVTAYGFMPILISDSELQRMHGIDERLSLENLEQGIRILSRVIEELAAIE